MKILILLLAASFSHAQELNFRITGGPIVPIQEKAKVSEAAPLKAKETAAPEFYGDDAISYIKQKDVKVIYLINGNVDKDLIAKRSSEGIAVFKASAPMSANLSKGIIRCEFTNPEKTLAYQTVVETEISIQQPVARRIVVVGSANCVYCRILEGHMSQAGIIFEKVDGNSNPGYGARSYPTTIVYEGSREIARYVGVFNVQILQGK